jgi:hypothetical protein
VAVVGAAAGIAGLSGAAKLNGLMITCEARTRVWKKRSACNREGVQSLAPAYARQDKGTFSLPSELAIFGKRFGDAF